MTITITLTKRQIASYVGTVATTVAAYLVAHQYATAAEGPAIVAAITLVGNIVVPDALNWFKGKEVETPTPAATSPPAVPVPAAPPPNPHAGSP